MRFNLGSQTVDFSFYMRPLRPLAETLLKSKKKRIISRPGFKAPRIISIIYTSYLMRYITSCTKTRMLKIEVVGVLTRVSEYIVVIKAKSEQTV